jgi:hypothetical protein
LNMPLKGYARNCISNFHVDAGALAFTGRKNLPLRHLLQRHFGKTNQNTQHNIVW